MKKILNAIFVLSLVFIIGACQNEKVPQPAHLRAVSMVRYGSATLTITGQGTNKSVKRTFSLNYSKPTKYQTFTPGYYKINLSVHGKTLLEGTYALGQNGYYSLLAMGLLPETWKMNPRTTTYKLKYIFAGEEVKSTNKYLPQWTMMRDNYDGSKQRSYIRLVNANPTTATLKIKKGRKTLKSGLAYPIESSMIKLKPGHHKLHIYYGQIEMTTIEMEAKPGYIYTAIVGNKEHQANKLTVSMLVNPSRSLLKK